MILRTLLVPSLVLLTACGPEARPASTRCTGTVAYDEIGGTVSEVTHLQDRTAFFVSKGTPIDERTSSETGGALIVGKRGNVVWFEWPAGFALSSGIGQFETPDMRCETSRAAAGRTETRCLSKKDGSLWLDYVSDARGVYEYQRHADPDYAMRMRRRGACGLSYEALAALETSERL